VANQLLSYRWKQKVFCFILMKRIPHTFGTIYVYVKNVPSKNHAPLSEKCFRKGCSDCIGKFSFWSCAAGNPFFFPVILGYVLDDYPPRTCRTLEEKDKKFRRNVKTPLLIGTAAYPRRKKKVSYFYLFVNILKSDSFLS
jgi:hypothetical protein